MLSRIIIQNYAIIDSLEIEFSAGLNVITGETGAGKSIIVGALGLILGERADSSQLVNHQKKCMVEGWFATKGKKDVITFLQLNDLDILDELVIRREIGINGKSRAFINDTPVTVSQLNTLSHLLVDLHQQFDTLALGESDFQRQVIDAMANQVRLTESYQVFFKEWKLVDEEARLLREQKQQFDKEADYHQFQFDELEEAGFKENELENIEAELKMMSHAEGIKTALDKIYFELNASEYPLSQQLRQLVQQLSAFEAWHTKIPGLVERLQSAQIELKDIADETDQLSRQINYDPAAIDQLNERLSVGYKLQKKHAVHSTSALLAIHAALKEKLQAVLHIDEAIAEKEKESSRLLAELKKMAEKISTGRKKQVKPFEEKVNQLLAQVGMPNAKIKVAITPVDLHINGADQVEFLFDANKSGRFQSVKKVASGGELSRLMLCIKSLVAASIDLPALIFDEIDTGISGEAARQVSIIMKELATNRQLICITHQPQIAGKANAHFFVYKEIVNDAVKTNIQLLSMEERITTIARMLSGEKPTAAAMENAREMVMN